MCCIILKSTQRWARKWLNSGLLSVNICYLRHFPLTRVAPLCVVVLSISSLQLPITSLPQNANMLTNFDIHMSSFRNVMTVLAAFYTWNFMLPHFKGCASGGHRQSKINTVHITGNRIDYLHEAINLHFSQKNFGVGKTYCILQ